jgi:hypothetical protein
MARPVRHARVSSGEARFGSVRLAGPVWSGLGVARLVWQAQLRKAGPVGPGVRGLFCPAKVRHARAGKHGLEGRVGAGQGPTWWGR